MQIHPDTSGMPWPLPALQQQRPQAAAILRGSSAYPGLRGGIGFYQAQGGVFVVAEVQGLPAGKQLPCQRPIFALHMHSGGSCSGNAEDPFANAGAHYNPGDCPHPEHSGDFPPLFGNNGYAFSAFFTDRFSIAEIIGKTVIIHAGPDDFTTQPAGNAGAKIACGVITTITRK